MVKSPGELNEVGLRTFVTVIVRGVSELIEEELGKVTLRIDGVVRVQTRLAATNGAIIPHCDETSGMISGGNVIVTTELGSITGTCFNVN